jgi:hypothetical protein
LREVVMEPGLTLTDSKRRSSTSESVIESLGD